MADVFDDWWSRGGWSEELEIPAGDVRTEEVRRARVRQVLHRAHPEIPVDSHLERLRELARKLGRTPSRADMAAAGLGHMAYVRRYGSVTEAQRLAGLEPNEKGWPNGL